MKKENKGSKESKPQKNYLYLAYRAKEYLWLAFTILSIIISIYQLIAGTREEATYFIGLTVLSGLFYSFNRYRRLKWEKRDAEAAAGNPQKAEAKN
ncbi:MAG: hypothetical protein ACXVPN_16560 [Bacteroidia bacterium]